MPVITNEPQNVTVGQYDRAEFTVGLDTTTDATVYTWYLRLEGDSGSVKVQQSRNPKFVVAEASTGLHKYFCEIDVAGDGVTVLTSRTCLLHVYQQVIDTTKLAVSDDFGGPSSQSLEIYKSQSPEQYPNLTYEVVGDYVHDPAMAPDQILGGGSASDLPADGRYWEQVDAGSAETIYPPEDYFVGSGDAATTFDFEPIPVRATGPERRLTIQPIGATPIPPDARSTADSSLFYVESKSKTTRYSFPPRDVFDETKVIWAIDLTPEEEA